MANHSYQLTVKTGSGKGRSWPIGEAPLLIGRGEACGIRLPDPMVSRKHCELRADKDKLYLRDLESRNATFLNGRPVIQGRLGVGDELGIGHTVFVITTASVEVETPLPEGEETPLTVAIEDSACIRRYSRATMLEASPRSIVELHNLFQISRAFASVTTLHELVQELCAVLQEHLAPDALWLAWYIGGEEPLSFHPMPSEVAPSEAPHAAMLRAVMEQQALLLPRTREQDDGKRVISFLVAPVIFAGQRIGCIALRGADDGQLHDEEKLQFFAGVVQAFAPLVRSLEQTEQLRRDYEHLRRATGMDHQLLGEAPAMQELRRMLVRAAQTQLNVLLLGETGTGKELAARMVHDHSSRADRPYITLNCAAIPRELFESEMFGHEKGAFTGADRQKPGLFEEANGGTLFLDEIGDLSPDNQARILRALETGAIRRVGGRTDITVDVRIVAATNQDLSANHQARFRRDLYHRLNGVELRLPPLREHLDDVPLLAHHFLVLAQGQAHHHVREIAPEALARLQSYDWPGNVRELRACIERATMFCDGSELQAEDIVLPRGEQNGEAEAVEEGDLLPLSEVEKAHIGSVLRQCEGNISRAARILQITRGTLYKKIRDYNLPY